ncbi:MAG: peptidylprolyl isomerase [Candidatus Kapaibacteriales bacterium]
MMKYLLFAVAFFSIGLVSCKEKPLMAIIKTNKGNITLDLYGKATPLTVGNLVNLAERGYYDGVLFHRVVPNFVIQGGDPTGTGAGGPGYRFEDEIVDTLRHNSEGILSMANAGPTTNGSQFFITHKATPHLDGKHAVFGKVVDGMDIVNMIEQRDTIYTIEIMGDIPEEMKAYQSRFDGWNDTLSNKNLNPKLNLKAAQPIHKY